MVIHPTHSRPTCFETDGHCHCLRSVSVASAPVTGGALHLAGGKKNTLPSQGGSRKTGTAQGPTTGALLPGHIECDQVSRRSSTVTVRPIVPLRRVLPGRFCDVLSPRTACTSKKNPACMQARSRHAGTLHACSPEACLPGGAQNAAHIEKKMHRAGRKTVHACMQPRCRYDACTRATGMQTRCTHADTMHACEVVQRRRRGPAEPP